MSFLGAQNSIALGVQGIIAIDTGTGTIAVVTDPYWPYVSMLLHGDGVNAAQNNTFLDGSANNFTVTRNGNTTQGSFNPFVKTYPYAVATNGGSAYFDGTGDYLTVPDSTAFTLGANDFTIECWVYPTTTGSTGYLAGQANAAFSSTSFTIARNGATTITAAVYIAGTNYDATSTLTVPINVWTHVAFVRNSTINRLYINGVQSGTNSFVTTQSVDNSSGAVGVGAAGDYTGQRFLGYISNFRLVNGTCLYPSSTTFTPPTAPLTAVTNTALLLGMSNGAIYDNTMLNNLETVANAQISTSVFKYGTGALKFNGTTDYLPTPAKTAFVLGSGDFTIECWGYWNGTGNCVLVGQANSTGTTNPFYIDKTFGGNFISAIYATGHTAYFCTSVATIPTATWFHIAFVRNGNTLRQYINGVQDGTANVTGLSVETSTGSVSLGALGDYPGYYLNGYIDDFRFTKGICRYPSGTTFTPPTAAFPNS